MHGDSAVLHDVRYVINLFSFLLGVLRWSRRDRRKAVSFFASELKEFREL